MDDLISRVEAIDALKRAAYWQDGERKIAELPAVDAVPVVHARPIWINPLNPGAKICMWQCSSVCSACGDYVAIDWKYCPNCGAKMGRADE